MDKSRTSGEWERMVSGQLYTPADPEIAKRHRVGMHRCDRFNRLPLWCTKTKQRALERLIPSAEGKNFEAFAPFYCEYGVNIYVGRNCFINYNSVFLDVAPISFIRLKLHINAVHEETGKNRIAIFLDMVWCEVTNYKKSRGN